MSAVLKKYSGSVLVVILGFAYLTRMYHLNVPEAYVFDEVYHAVTAKLMAQNDDRAFEWWNPAPEPKTAVDWLHPPFAKYTQALSILAFGENSFGWRFSSVVFGTLVILLTYLLTVQLFKDEKIGLLAAGLASLDGLLLVQSRIAMNDIHVTFFMLLTFLLYAKFRESRSLPYFLLTGIAAGLAVGTKWSGVFALLTIGTLELFTFITHALSQKKHHVNRKRIFSYLILLSKYVVFWILVPAILYLAAYSQMFLQGKDWTHFKELHNQIWYYQTHLDATHPYQSRPWQWALNLRPVWYHVEYKESSRADIYAFGNPLIFWGGLGAIAGSLILLAVPLCKKLPVTKRATVLSVFTERLHKIISLPLFLLIFAYFAVWLPWIISPRIMFFYHYTPAVPLLCIALAFWLEKFWNQPGMLRQVAGSFVLLAFIIFLIWYPHWIGIPISNELKDLLYFSINSWK